MIERKGRNRQGVIGVCTQNLVRLRMSQSESYFGVLMEKDGEDWFYESTNKT